MRYEKISEKPGATHEERIHELEERVNILIDAVEHLHSVIEKIGVVGDASENKVQ